MKLSLVIPCYNEESNLHLLIPRCIELCRQLEVEVILVDNGSHDNTFQTINNLARGCKKIRSLKIKKNKGYGFGILSGLKIANGDILGWCHADMQTDPLDLISGFQIFQKHRNPENLFVKGLRYGRPLGDNIFTFGMSCFETVLLGVLMRDINAQPTIFHKSFFEGWRTPPFDFSLDLFAYHAARIKQLEVQRFPVRFSNRAYGNSHWNVDWASKKKFIKRTIMFSLELRQNLKE